MRRRADRSFEAHRLTRRDWLQSTSLAAAATFCPKLVVGQTAAASPTFELSFPGTLREAAFSGRVYVCFGRHGQEPRFGPNWMAPEPMLAKDVVNLRPGDVVTLSVDDPDVMAFPRDFARLDLSRYRAQGVMRFNPWERTVGTGPGNAISRTVGVPGSGEEVRLPMASLLSEIPPRESRWSRPFAVPSPLLSAFHRRPVSVRGQVTLPASWYDAPEKRYPVIFEIPGFGGTAAHGYRAAPVRETNSRGVEFLRVMLDPGCPLGHHVFADSANNGPWGRSLVEEFLPAFESEFRTIAEPRGRLLTGHSSGGWSSLWVQISHPDVFGGTWSTAPDPVDFRDFQRINVYRPDENMYRTPGGERRPLARDGERVLLWYDDFCLMEDVLGPGGQLHSFEAVFSPRNDDGRPRLLWNRETGAIDPHTAAAWTAYDIRLVLEDRWSDLASRLKGKLNIHMGEADTFYLDGATRLLKTSLHDLGNDAVVELYPGEGHSSVLTPGLLRRIAEEMATVSLMGAM